MHAIDAPGNVSGQFTNGDPNAIPPIPATEVDDEWLNDVQDGILDALAQAGIAPVKGLDTQLTDAIRVLGGGGGGSGSPSKNLLDNSDFWLWQRGFAAAAFTGIKYTADRWRAFANGGAGCATVTLQSVAAGDTTVPGQLLLDDLSPPAIPILRWVMNSNGTGVSTLEQRNDQLLQALAGRTVTLAVYGRVSSGSLQLTPEFEQNFGASGSASVLTTGSAWTLTTTWTRFLFTVAIPSISGKTLGAGYFLATRFKIPSGATFTFELRAAQLEESTVAGQYKNPGRAADLEACQRYYYKTYDRITVPATSGATQNSVNGQNSGTEATALGVRFPVEMRASPAVVFYTASTGASGNVERPVGTATAVTGVVGTGREYSGYPQTANQASDVQGRCHIAADSEL